MYFNVPFLFMPPPFEEWWRGIKCYSCPSVRSYGPFIETLRKNWCQLNNFWKTALIPFIFGMLIYNIKTQVEFECTRHSKNGEGALSFTPVRACVRPCVRPSVIKMWCPLNNFWTTASIQFKFGMLIYNIKTQVEFDLGYNPLIFDRVMCLL